MYEYEHRVSLNCNLPNSDGKNTVCRLYARIFRYLFRDAAKTFTIVYFGEIMNEMSYCNKYR